MNNRQAFWIVWSPTGPTNPSRRHESASDALELRAREGPGGLQMETERWQPPTDDERRLFMERCTHPDGFGHIGRFDSMKWVFDGHPADCPYCNRNWREIAESLALDGADYDNMPDFEELER